jgi:hypothetical protein
MTQTKKSIAWIGDLSWAGDVSCTTNDFGTVTGGVIFKTREEARAQGWKKPVRVEISIRKAKPRVR